MRSPIAVVPAVVAMVLCPVAQADTVYVLPGAQPGHIFAVQAFPELFVNQGDLYVEYGAGFYSVDDDAEVTFLDFSREPFLADWSIEEGRVTLDFAIKAAQDQGKVVVVSESMGTMVAAAEQRVLLDDPDAPAPDALMFVELDGPQRGVAEWFPVGHRAPIVPWTVEANVESQYDVVVIYGEYDGWADPPDRPWNAAATANGIMGMALVHGRATLADDPADIPEENITVETNSRGGTVTTYRLPTEQLPLTYPLRTVLPGKVVDDVDDVLRPVIDSAYVRHDEPGDTRPYLHRGKIVRPSVKAVPGQGGGNDVEESTEPSPGAVAAVSPRDRHDVLRNGLRKVVDGVGGSG